MATTFLVAVEGIDGAPLLRSGDISATGVYFETDRDVGEVGTIHWLNLVTADSLRAIHVMAYVVRTIALADASGRKSGGVAFEFMPESDDASKSLHDFVHHALSLRHASGGHPRVASRLDAEVSAPREASAATVKQLSVRSMVLETSWAIEPGEPVRVDIVAPGMTRRIRLEGRAVRVAPKPASPSTFAIEVEVQEESDRPLRRHSSMSFEAVSPEVQAKLEAEVAAASQRVVAPPAPPPSAREDDVTQALDDLLAALILPPDDDARRGRRARQHHLSGQIARIRLPTLCALFDMERLTGRLVIKRGIEESRLYLKDGMIVDVEPLAPGEAIRARLRELLAWDEGDFDFSVEPVERPNRVGLGTTALLIDLAREADELAR